MVRKERLELSQVALLEPKSSASTSSATFAKFCTSSKPREIIKQDARLVKKNKATQGKIRLHKLTGVNDGIRTHDNRDHNPGLYQLSYAHHHACRQLLNLLDVWYARQDSNLLPSA